MGVLDYFLASRKKTAVVAKERLQILVAHERAERGRPSYLPLLQREILEVIRKYVPVQPDDVTVKLDREDGCEILELSVVLPEPEARSARRA